MFLMILRPPRSTLLTHSFPTRRSSDLPIAYDSAHVFVNLRASWESEDGTYNAQAFVTNLFRNRSMINPRDTVLGSAGKYNTTEGEGRLWGVKFEIGRASCRERGCQYV